ncbi:N-6 DNA methylase [Vagococcus sp. CY52-2]|uniref:N-6 DNA methylase n=1 Tax=Vagococcus sp. CY52-2 TaxID=2925838 RepID=UPI001F598310|nr:N-6 DNA methylase [Vagococcus sp. CY52-2]UNM90572.1 SAM-dependent methyltransferase [Vagococcus sp. CY52-2]UNM90624.1 SAM-dependent methyltransferase [Vagococcus sp. CY52-2]
MLSISDINNLIGVDESFHASYKLSEILEQKEVREDLFNRFLKKESDLSYDWFTEYFQAEHSDRKGKKQDFTPDGIIKIASGVLGPVDSNADICAGTGGLTIKRYSENKDASFYCEEFSDRAMPFLLFNLAIRNVDATVFHGDSLTREAKSIYKLSKSDIYSDIEKISEIPEINAETTIMNPPYSIPWDAKKERLQEDRFKDYEVLAPKAKADYAFLLQGLHMLKENGVMSIILPHGVLFRGAAEGKIRQKLLELNYIDAVIGLPPKAFIATDIPTVILVLKKNRCNKDVLFIDASKECVKSGSYNVIEQDNVNKILSIYHEREIVDKFSNVITFDEILENDFNLNIPRYVDTFEEEEPIDLTKNLNELQEIDKKIRESEIELASMLSELVSSDVNSSVQEEIDGLSNYFYQRNNHFPRKKTYKGEQLSLL